MMHDQFVPEGIHPAIDQQQLLLYPLADQGPPSTQSLAEQLELSGAHVEETLSRLNCQYQSLFFLAAWGVAVASVIGLISSILQLEFSSLLLSIYLFFFGCATMVFDIPGNPRWAGKYRKLVRRYVRFLTSLTGKSIWLFYLGCTIIASFWPSNTRKLRFLVLMRFLLFLISLYVLSVATLGLFIAIRKSLRLERIRQSLLNTYQSNWADIYRKYAVNDPAHGLQYEEFNRMVSDYSHGKLIFGNNDLQIIYNALDEHQKHSISEAELNQWITAGGHTYTGRQSSWLSMTFL